MTNKIIIYDLSCPITGNVRYVGKTSKIFKEYILLENKNKYDKK